jgi:hypothetical protein
MSAFRNGGPAFPQSLTFSPEGIAHVAGEYFANCDGMTLRDWLAGMALPSVYKEGVGEITETEMALDCYRIADAMIAAREKEEA